MTYKCPLKKIVHDLFEGILNPLNNIQIKKNALMSNSMAETSYHQPPQKNLETTEQKSSLWVHLFENLPWHFFVSSWLVGWLYSDEILPTYVFS